MLAMTKRTILLIAICAAGCRDEQPAQPSAEQSAQLNETENLLDAAANEEGPADRSAGPSNSTD
jgi:hypothetical protein